MSRYDVFNGDADGIFSLMQLRRAFPDPRQLVTGVKRDIALLDRIADAERVTVLDLSLDRNRAALERLLAQGTGVDYWDHHFAGEVPEHSALAAHLDPAPGVCTALIVDEYLNGAQDAWALAGAYGDNLDAVADKLGRARGYSPPQLGQLAELGRLVNYNGYGRTLSDLHFDPADLYRRLMDYDNPFAVMADPDSPAAVLARAYREDLNRAQNSPMLARTPRALAWQLPDSPWAHRISGSWANEQARRHPDHAIVLATPVDGDALRLSVRAPFRGQWAPVVDLCRRFGGGGRAKAGGVDALPGSQMADFLQQLNAHFDDNCS